MRLFLASLALIASLLAPFGAQAQCLLCGIAGFALGSSSGGTSAGPSGGAVIYVAPRLAERLAEPLAVRFTSTPPIRFSTSAGNWEPGKTTITLQEMFARTLLNAEKFDILEVLRIVDGAHGNVATFWFVYIEKEKLKPLDQLPPPAAKQ